jgi:hydroxymethylbilane synthase
VAALLTQFDETIQVEFVATDTFADRDLSLPIAELGGKGAFSKEIQALVLADEADIAVHSAKDLQATTPDGLHLAAIPERGDERDALIGRTLADLPPGATIATGSNRRRVQLAHLRPDLRFIGLRGNIATRLSKLDGCDALVMANVPLARLQIEPEIVDVIDPSVMVPQVGQGALAVECRSDATDVIDLLSAIDHEASRRAVEAERGFLVELGGDCELPAGAHAVIGAGGSIDLTAVLASPDERRLERTTQHTADPHSAPAELGAAAARELRARLDLVD